MLGRRKIYAAYLGLTAVLMFVAGVPLIVCISDVEWTRLVNRSLGRVNDLSAELADGPARPSSAQMAEILGRALRERGDSAMVVDATGQVVASAGGAVGTARVAELVRRSRRGERVLSAGMPPNRMLSVADRMQGPGPLHGAVVLLDVDTRRMHTKIIFWMLGIGAAGLAGLGLAAVAAEGLARGVRTSMRMLELTVGELERGEQVVRLAAAHTGPLETRGLIDAMNRFAATNQAVTEEHRFFLSDVAHQLGTQLQLLNGRLGRLGEHVGPEGGETYGMAVSDVERLRISLNDLQQLSGLIEPSPPDEVDVCAVVAERTNSWAEVALGRELTLTPVLHEERPLIMVRRGTLEQILDILLDNAFKHSPPGGEIKVLVKVGISVVNVQIVDQGPGLTAEERRHATERGWRGKRARDERDEKGGRGLGLSIALNLASSNGGRLILGPGPRDRGLAVLVQFPLVPGQGTGGQDPPGRGAGPPGGPGR